MTKEEIMSLVAKFIEGQGNQVDIGSVLPIIFNAIQDEVNRINLTIGSYSDREPIVLQTLEANVAVNKDGELVYKEGWGIATFTAEKGNEYLFNAGTIDSDVCIFAEKITKSEVRQVNYTYQYNEDGYPVKATASYNGVTYSYTITYTKDEDGNIIGEKITDDYTGEELNALPYQYRTEVGTYSPLTILNASAELPMDNYCRFISHFQGNGTIEVVVSFNLATADKTMLVLRDGYTANLATQLGKLSQLISDLNKVVSYIEGIADTNAININGIIKTDTTSALPLLCGQPPILYGAGTPQKAIVPINWKQYDAETGEGYNWNGDPSAIGQQYINTNASSGGRYIAVPSADGGLTWKNF